MHTINVPFEAILGAPDDLANWALITDACHHVAVLSMAPDALLPFYELATWNTHEPAGR